MLGKLGILVTTFSCHQVRSIRGFRVDDSVEAGDILELPINHMVPASAALTEADGPSPTVLEESVAVARHRDGSDTPGSLRTEELNASLVRRPGAPALLDYPAISAPTLPADVVVEERAPRQFQEPPVAAEQATASAAAGATAMDEPMKMGPLRRTVEAAMGPGAGTSDVLVHCFLIFVSFAACVAALCCHFIIDMRDVFNGTARKTYEAEKGITSNHIAAKSVQDTPFKLDKDAIVAALKAKRAEAARHTERARYQRDTGPKKRRPGQAEVQSTPVPEEQACGAEVAGS